MLPSRALEARRSEARAPARSVLGNHELLVVQSKCAETPMVVLLRKVHTEAEDEAQAKAKEEKEKVKEKEKAGTKAKERTDSVLVHDSVRVRDNLTNLTSRRGQKTNEAAVTSSTAKFVSLQKVSRQF